uniref:UDENN domain-containing protein n=1 Tax=Entomoneis paludosa TaxID=265537 RepID=A0A7S2YHD9_9STRA|mmetsp:Transcript_33209/g.69183  ORF Transcript_33209/g.69183 Transcript_33209/m.69183 type:complete len:270 (+) Transcript_33209:2-811(+)
MEQKIVITGSRRSVLLSATTALAEMLKPLKWCHLMVPRVPSNLAGDLLQYPAPFILGMPAQDPGILELIRELPEDVTLVDLDVGRVILASSFSTEDLSRGTPKNETTARALRTQVLSLAQCLGNVFGTCIDPASWSCDKLLFDGAGSGNDAQSRFPALKSACHDFLQELLAGATSCCYWIEEATCGNTDDEPRKPNNELTVLFDEDRFFRIKDARHKHPFMPLLSPASEGTKLAMGMDNFNLILEVFLRCQSMNAYIGSREQEEMIFSL